MVVASVSTCKGRSRLATKVDGQLGTRLTI
jgi:hypothetical protein